MCVPRTQSAARCHHARARRPISWWLVTSTLFAALALNDQLYRRVRKRFERKLLLWATADPVHMLLIATFGLSGSGVPAIDTLSLTPVTGQWLPIEDLAERQLLERLVRDGRTFVKALRYGVPDSQALASAILTDVDGPPVALCIARPGQDEPQMAAEMGRRAHDGGCSAWIWRGGDGGDASIPPRGSSASREEIAAVP